MPLSDAARQNSDFEGELMPRVFHELAQPLSALMCSLEVALGTSSRDWRCTGSLENALQIAQRLHSRLVYFRNLSQALQTCDVLRPIEVSGVAAAALQEMQELGQSLGIRIATQIDNTQIYGNPEKLQFALVRLLDWFFQLGRPGCVRLVSDARSFGELRLFVNEKRTQPTTPPSLEIVRAALSAMSAALQMEVEARTMRATIVFSPCHDLQGTTSVLFGDF